MCGHDAGLALNEGNAGLLNQKRVLVPVSMGPEGLELLQRRPDLQVIRYDPAIATAEFHAMLRDSAAVALSWTPFRPPELAAAPRLEVVARLGVGFDAVDVPALTGRGIPLMVSGTANSRAVAEHAMHLMFALAKRAAEMDRRVRQGIGHDRLSGLPGEVAGKTVLVVGFGRIGSRTAPRCRAMEMEVLVYDPLVDAGVIRAAGYEPVADLDAALPRADFTTIHCPKNAETAGLFGAARLALMRPGAFLVNTARRHRRRDGAGGGAGVRPSRRRGAGRVRSGAAGPSASAAADGDGDRLAAYGWGDARVLGGDVGDGGAEHAGRAGRRAKSRECGQSRGSARGG